MEKGVRILARPPAGWEAVVSEGPLAFVEGLHRALQPTRRELLERRQQIGEPS